MNNKDLRVIKTREAVENAFLSLLDERPFDELTISDIIQRAGVNRSTFYRHYKDKNDLLDTYLKETMEEYHQNCNSDYLDLDPKDIATYHDQFRSLLEFFEQRKEKYRILWGPNVGRDVFGEMIAYAAAGLKRSINQSRSITLTRRGYDELYARLFSSNLMVMVKWKLMSDTDATVDDVAATMTSHMKRGLFASLKKEK